MARDGPRLQPCLHVPKACATTHNLLKLLLTSATIILFILLMCMWVLCAYVYACSNVFRHMFRMCRYMGGGPRFILGVILYLSPAYLLRWSLS